MRNAHRNRGLTAASLFVIVVAVAAARAERPASQPAAQAGGADRATQAPSGNAENGRHLFRAKGCYECHGYAAQGGSTGPRLGPRPITFKAFTEECRHPRNNMPPYTAKVLSDSELADIYAFVQALPSPPDPNGLAILR